MHVILWHVIPLHVLLITGLFRPLFSLFMPCLVFSFFRPVFGLYARIVLFAVILSIHAFIGANYRLFSAHACLISCLACLWSKIGLAIAHSAHCIAIDETFFIACNEKPCIILLILQMGGIWIPLIDSGWEYTPVPFRYNHKPLLSIPFSSSVSFGNVTRWK